MAAYRAACTGRALALARLARTDAAAGGLPPVSALDRNIALSSSAKRTSSPSRTCFLSGRQISGEPSKNISNRKGYCGVMPARASTAASADGDDENGTGHSVRAKPKHNGSKEVTKDERLWKIREEMERANGGKGVDAYIVPSEDPHQSEWSSECFARRAFVSRFTGSAGTAVITKEHAALWTDGRYFLQASQQLGPEWQLMRSGQPGVPEIDVWLRDVLPQSSRVGIDPFLHSANSARDLAATLSQRSSTLVPIYEHNLVDLIWGIDQPPLPSAPLRVHELKYAGREVSEKLSELRKELVEAGATAIVVPLLDEVAWLFNLRGGDIPHCPVTIAYAVVHLDAAFLFVDEAKVTSEVAAHLEGAGVSVKQYNCLIPELEQAAASGAKLWVDPSRVSTALVTAFDRACGVYYERTSGTATEHGTENESVEASEKSRNGPLSILRPSPIAMAKSRKNGAELEGMRQAHIRDGAALARFWAWLESHVAAGQAVTEVKVSDCLEEFRRHEEGFLDTSFDTIAGSGPNGAIIHYRAEEATCGDVNDKKLFLLDSGAQYVDGTTDITRTVHFGQPNGYQKNCFTRVLKGHIALDRAVFPEGTPGFVLDVLARKDLWEIGLDYRHGTGHGVGAALNVHEGPQGISPRFGNMTGLFPGMIVSNEPGYYEDGSFGIRIENLLIVKEVGTPNNFGGNSFLGFERLTFCPIQIKMIDFSIMSDEDVDWLNQYHAEVWNKVSPRLEGDALEWLKRSTLPVGRPAPRPAPASAAGALPQEEALAAG